ncbi:hypothetical protein TH25_06560 [Thalassospira profundimaris]|uniref:DUF4159 domain-containing protein n=1 Tax=Thalassospira profundimaris TaxID=502049 RepID=A0A367XEW8_9PROT|nr:DUF4159 domain-containing protein [Thalassospira profundimaris]RCK52194.1 hypothetical protein TH25_06560 [Thalassospira profundimaris]
MTFGALTFLYPVLLAGLLLVPVLWLIIRSAPRKPRRIHFPAARLLLGATNNRRNAEHAPLWQTILRSAILLCLILAAAHPVLNKKNYAPDHGALLVMVDNSWSSAANWPQYQKGMKQIVNQARLNNQSIFIAVTAPETSGANSTDLPALQGPLSPHASQNAFDRIQPRPWQPDYQALDDMISARQDIINAISGTILISDDITAPGKETLANDLSAVSPFIVLHPVARGQETAIVLAGLNRNRNGMTVDLTHPVLQNEKQITLIARGSRGQVILRHPATLERGTTKNQIDISMPGDIANGIQTLGLAGIESAAALFQTGAKWQRRTVGIVVNSGEGPVLLSDRYFFLDRALSPYADIHYGTLADLLEKNPDILVTTGNIPDLGSQQIKLASWLDKGGLLVRFASDSASSPEDRFLPVTLRLGNRDFGGSMSWERPKHLAAFGDTSPFYGLPIPGDITINRQLLAEPDRDIVEKTWARLSDGTPLVTSVAKNAGRIVLFHVTPWADWSNLPMSGLFVQIWQRILPLASPDNPSSGTIQSLLPPQSILDGFGQPHQPDPTILGLQNTTEMPDPRHPPGIYGQNGQAVAHNLGPFIQGLDKPIRWPEQTDQKTLADDDQLDLAALCVFAAFCLFLLDTLILILTGMNNRFQGYRHGRKMRSRPSSSGGETTISLRPETPADKSSTPFNRLGMLVVLAGSLGLALTITGMAPQASAQENTSPRRDSFQAALHPRLAYMETGVAAIDRLSQAGLTGLTETLRRRTAADLAPPSMINPQTDDLSFYPLIYWPLTEGQNDISAYGREQLNRYLANGGMILIDSRDREVEPARLRRLLAGVEIPTLTRAPTDHVVFRSFYLLDQAYGRFDAPLWVDARPDPRLDGVASVLFGGNDWAASWVPTRLELERYGEATSNPIDDISPRRHELALRFGVNLVIYALTGSYKGDQVHLPAILERLGR